MRSEEETTPSSLQDMECPGPIQQGSVVIGNTGIQYQGWE